MRALFLGLITTANLIVAQDKPVPLVQAVPLPHHITAFRNDHGQDFTAAHYDPADMRPFWYPIMASKGISLVRMGHPHDPLTHSHHNGVWISHNKVNGLDFWGDHTKPEVQGRIINIAIPREAYTDSDEGATMQMINHWVKAADNSVQLIETRRCEVRPLNGFKSWLLIIDLEFTTPAGKTATFAPTYFGLVGVRVAKSIGVLDGGGRVLNSEGQLNEEGTFRKPARWCDYSGRITNDQDGFAGITLMNHPSNPQNPTPFHVRNDGWMCACLTSEDPPLSIEVSAEKKLRVKYALWVHDGVTTQAQSEAIWQTFAAMPQADLVLGKK